MEAEQTIYLEFENRLIEQLAIAHDWTGDDLCAQIKAQIWTDLAADTLVLIRKSENELLTLAKTLVAQNVQENERLLVLKSRRLPLESKFRAQLVEVEMGDTYPIEWQPAVIGRPGYVRDKELLAADLTWLPDGITISRNHAVIHEQKGHFFIRHIAIENQTIINGHPTEPDCLLEPNRDYPLKHNTIIKLGKRQIALRFLLDLPQGA